MPRLANAPRVHMGREMPPHYRGRRRFPLWLLAVDVLCVVVVLTVLVLRLWDRGAGPGAVSPPPVGPDEVAAAMESETSPAPSAQPTAVPSPEASSLPSAPVNATAAPDVSAPPAASVPLPPEGSVVPANIAEIEVPQGEAKDSSWFSDAVLVGDSRIDGFRIYSGITECDYIIRTGMSVYDVAERKQNVKVGDRKYSVMELLEQKPYAKIYLSMGVNELGYYNPEGYGAKYGDIIDQIRSLQPDAEIYVQTIIPVNAAMCAENNQPEYVNNEIIRQYNASLVEMAVNKGVLLVNPVEALEDDTGEIPAELSSDGVHFKAEGYILWRDYLLCHTGA